MISADNVVMLTGRIPQFKNSEAMKFIAAKDDNHQDLMNFTLSVNTSRINKDSKYPESVLIRCKAWGYGAKYINERVQAGDTITVCGEWRNDDDWEDSEGNTHKGTPFVYCHDVRGRKLSGEPNASEGADAKAVPAPKAPAARKNPLMGGARPKGNPLMGGARRRHNVI